MATQPCLPGIKAVFDKSAHHSLPSPIFSASAGISGALHIVRHKVMGVGWGGGWVYSMSDFHAGDQ